MVFFGSSSDDCIRALDERTGETRWTFYTEGPVRFAPAYANGVVYTVSDDGYLYALSATDGTLHWKKHGGAGPQKIIGNGRLISRTPARGGPVVLDQTVYFAAGIWPSDGIFLHALAAETGNPVWKNDTAGSMYMPQPHGGAHAHSGVSAQGYLAADSEQLFMPTGRAVPAAFDRSNGNFNYFHLQRNGHSGGATIMLQDEFFLNSGKLFRRTDGALVDQYGEGPIAATTNGFVHSARKSLDLYRWEKEVNQTDRKGTVTTRPGYVSVTNLTGFAQATSVAVAGDQIVLGGENQVTIVSSLTGERVWSNRVAGTVHGLALTAEGLFATTDEGTLYSFNGYGNAVQAQAPKREAAPYHVDPAYEQVAREILDRSQKRAGYCLDLACSNEELVVALARNSSLKIIGIDSNPKRVSQTRKRLTQAGLYGSRITILEGTPDSILLPDYFADLIVSTAALSHGSTEIPAWAKDLQRPYGGVACLGKRGAMRTHARGALPGAGQWTHQYANAANTVCSDDTIVRGPLSMLWFEDPGQQMVQRHGRAPAPLFHNGTIFSEGLNGLYAVDAYNGRTKWTYEIPGVLQAYEGDHLMGTSGTGSNYCAADDCIYLRNKSSCLKINAHTGELMDTFEAPAYTNGHAGTWGYVAAAHGHLFGSLSDTNHVVTYRYQNSGDLSQQLTQSKTLFALHADDGYLKWRYDATYSIRHNAIAVASNQVLLIDAPLADYDRQRKGKPASEDRGKLVSIDIETGEILWSKDEGIYGTVLAISMEHQAILMSYQPTRFGLASELGGRLSALDLRNGDLLWERKADYSARPMINDRVVYTQGGAWDLLNGEPRPFNFTRSYGCGVLAGAKNMMVFRSATLGYFDLNRNQQTEEYGGIRPGCWINVIPAGGLVLAPDAAAGCRCSYLNQSWIALQPGGVRAPRIRPASASSHEVIDVTMIPDQPDDEQVRYTTDGSSPDRHSAIYTRPIRLEESTLLKARSFDQHGRPGPTTEARYFINPDLLSLDPTHWEALDAPDANEVSDWKITGGGIEQHSNIYVNNPITTSKNPGVERPGSLYRFAEGHTFTDGRFAFTVNSADNDGIGVAFRMTGDDAYYLWSMNCERNYRLLAAKQGETFTVLSENNQGFKPNTDYDVEIRFSGPKLTIRVNGQKDIEVEDATFDHGTVALYTWGNNKVRFSHLAFSADADDR
jgi:outer membrane protein assembly factor BamB